MGYITKGLAGLGREAGVDLEEAWQPPTMTTPTVTAPLQPIPGTAPPTKDEITPAAFHLAIETGTVRLTRDMATVGTVKPGAVTTVKTGTVTTKPDSGNVGKVAMAIGAALLFL